MPPRTRSSRGRAHFADEDTTEPSPALPSPADNTRGRPSLPTSASILTGPLRSRQEIYAEIQATDTPQAPQRAASSRSLSPRVSGNWTTVNVRVRVNLMRLTSVDVKEGVFDAHVMLEASWVDESPDAVGNLDNSTELDRPLYKGWTPNIFIANRHELRKEEHWFRVFKHEDGPIVCHRVYAEGLFHFDASKHVDVHPFDSHVLYVEIVAGRPSERNVDPAERRAAQDASKCVLLMPNPGERYKSVAIWRNFTVRDEFDFEEPDDLAAQMVTSLTDPAESCSGTQYSKLRVNVLVKRAPWAVLLDRILPCALISGVGAATCAYEPADLGNRLALLTALLFPLLELKRSVSEGLPNLRVPTLGEGYILASILQTVALIAYSLLDWSIDQDRIDRGQVPLAHDNRVRHLKMLVQLWAFAWIFALLYGFYRRHVRYVMLRGQCIDRNYSALWQTAIRKARSVSISQLNANGGFKSD